MGDVIADTAIRHRLVHDQFADRVIDATANTESVVRTGVPAVVDFHRSGCAGPGTGFTLAGSSSWSVASRKDVPLPPLRAYPGPLPCR